MAPYQNCQFFVTDPSGDSPYFPLARGIRQGCPNIRTSLLFHEIFSCTPWTFPAPTHWQMLNMQMTQSSFLVHMKHHETLSRLLHLLQRLAARIGLLINGHGSLPVSLSLHADSHWTCNCPHCAPFFQVSQCEDSLGTPLQPLQGAKIPWILHCPYFILSPGCQLSMFPGLLRLQDSGSNFSSPTYFSKIQTSGLHRNSAGHSPSWIWISSLFSCSDFENRQLTL